VNFTHPIVFLLLLTIPILLIGAILAARARSKGWKKLVGHRLRHALVHEGAVARRWVSYGLGLFALLFLIATLTAPHAGYRKEAEIVRGRNILLAIDVSRSMLAKDESPNRLTAARAAALEVLELFPNDRIGLIAFSGGPWLHAPLTIDHGALVETLQQLDSNTLPRGGSDLSEAVKLAVETLKKTGQKDNALIIFSDGEAHDGDAARAAERAEEANLTIFTVGFGSEDGSFIPDSERPGERVRDKNGNLVFTQLKREDLQLLANRTGGFYTQGSGKQLSRSLRAAVERMDRSESEGGQRRIPIHRYQWFLLPAMILLILSLLTNTAWRLWTRSAVAVLALLFLPQTMEARVLPATAAEQALEAKDYATALDLFQEETTGATGERLARLKLGDGAAAYHAGRYSRALKSYSAALLSEDPGVQTEAHYALGNSLYQEGLSFLKNKEKPDLEKAITHLNDSLSQYDQALGLQKEHSHAQENRAHVEQVIEALKQQQEQEEKEQEQEPQDGEGDPNEDDPQNGEEGEPQDSPPEGDEGEQEAENPGQQDPKNEGEEGQDGEDQPPSEGQGEPEDGDTPPESEEGDSADGNPGEQAQNGEAKPQPQGKPEEDTGETPEERASRILADNADFQTTPLAQRHLKQPRTDKDW
jgi:Ca-activated chloride channel family protein